MTQADAAECLLRSRGVLWDAAREVAEKRGTPVNAADVHDVLLAIASKEAREPSTDAP